MHPHGAETKMMMAPTRRSCWVTVFILLRSLSLTRLSESSAFVPVTQSILLTRGLFLKRATATVSIIASSFIKAMIDSSVEIPDKDGSASKINSGITENIVAYRPMTVDLRGMDSSTSGAVGIEVPVAMWYPLARTADTSHEFPAKMKYRHRISISKVAQLVAGWKLPLFLKRDFALDSTGSVVDGTSIPTPSSGPVVLLAHGYLGSRFDLSHLGEFLARQGFICISPEYPESLAASYPMVNGLNRNVITSKVLQDMASEWKIEGTQFAAVGHSLGCGTAMATGDRSWVRVCIAGSPADRYESTAGGAVLFIGSVNDGAVSMDRIQATIPGDFALLGSDSPVFCAPTTDGGRWGDIPRRTGMIFRNPEDAPNHISFLAENVCDAMIKVLAPLLPIAQALHLSVLDFDKYKISRDSGRTAKTVLPVVNEYLRQHMF